MRRPWLDRPENFSPRGLYFAPAAMKGTTQLRQAPPLGRLEQQVMDDLWERGRAASVRDVRAALGTALAYTTLMTTLDRLFKKGLLERTKDGRAFLYAPRVSREQLQRGLLTRVLDGLLGRGTEAARPVLSTLVEAVSQADRQLLDELERMVAEERRRRGGKGRR
jgi:predicted transcriptional regulator